MAATALLAAALLFFISPKTIVAQTAPQLGGRVLNVLTQETLAGAHIRWMGAGLADTADKRGRYALLLPASWPDTLVARAAGYDEWSIVYTAAPADLKMDIQLQVTENEDDHDHDHGDHDHGDHEDHEDGEDHDAHDKEGGEDHDHEAHHDLTGKLTDAASGDGIAGAKIFWKRARTGAEADAKGRYTLHMAHLWPDTLVVLATGYKTLALPYPAEPAKPRLDIQLEVYELEGGVQIEDDRSAAGIDFMGIQKTENLGEAEFVKAACCNLSESLESNATIDVGYTDAVTGVRDIRMLGLDGVYTHLTTENQPVSRGLARRSALGYLPGPWLSSVQISKGPGSVVNGYEGMGGQINTQLKPAWEGDRWIINLYGNHLGRMEANLGYRHQINKRWSTIALLHASGLPTTVDNNGDKFLDNPKYYQLNGTWRWSYQGTKGFEAKFGGHLVYEDKLGGQTGYSTTQPRDTLNGYGVGMTVWRADVFGKFGWVNIKKPYQSVGIQTAGVLYRQDAYYGLRSYQGRNYQGQLNAIYQTKISDTRHVIQTGISLLTDRTTELLQNPGTDTLNLQRTEVVPGAFIEYTWKPDPKFTLVAGMRLDYNTVYGLFYTPRLHLRWQPAKNTTIRASGGSGWRAPNVLMDNSGILASSRHLHVTETLRAEQGWTYGLSITQNFRLWPGASGYASADFFRTDFVNRIMVDMDVSPQMAMLANQRGQAWSHAFQADLNLKPVRGLEVRASYKWYDVKQRLAGKIQMQPFVPEHRVMLNAAYTIKGVRLDFTANWYGPQRLPATATNPEVYQLAASAPAYWTLNALVGYTWRWLDVYTGVENLTGFRQTSPVLAAGSPWSQWFDASMVWGPILGRVFYLGVTFKIK